MVSDLIGCLGICKMQFVLPVCRGALLCFFLGLLFVSVFCHASDKKVVVEVVGNGDCAGCVESKIKPSHAFSGLRVTIDCKQEKGGFKTKGSGELDEGGKFTVSLAHDIVDGATGKLKEECYAQLHSASDAPCPAHDGLQSSKLLLVKSINNQKHTLGLSGKLKFSPVTCTSAFLWPYFKYPPLPTLPTFPLPPIYKKPCPPLFLPPPVPVYVKPPPVPVYKPPPVPEKKKPEPPPAPVYKPPPVPEKKPCPPDVPKVLPPPAPVYKPPPVPEKKPCPPDVPKVLPPPPPVYKPPPVPEKKPCPPDVPKVLPPPVPIYKPLPPIPEVLPPPVPIYKPLPPIPKLPPIKKPCPPKVFPPIPKLLPTPVPIYKPLPPIPKLPPFKKPCPPLPKLPHFPKTIPPKYFHKPKYGKWPPVTSLP
ncbi:proline-rich protein 4 [Carica papaya]|uniref:proline-rich protein 4 n=1 Tax=Carica papaya TaxID=3649 RepID=UPI000B8C9EDC|nr:proline-rich protein 4 [Carica papaya]